MVFLWKKSDFDVHVNYFNMHHTFITGNSLIKSKFLLKKKMMLLINLNFLIINFIDINKIDELKQVTKMKLN